MECGTVCDYDLPLPQESASGQGPPPPQASLLVRARVAASWPRPAALTPAAAAAAAPFEEEARLAPLEDGELRYLIYEGTPAADVFLERRLEAKPSEAADPNLFLEAARVGTARAVKALVRAGAWGAWEAPRPDGPDGLAVARNPEAPLFAALARKDAQALPVIAELARSAPKVGRLSLRAGLAGLGLADPPEGEGGGARPRPPLPVYIGPGGGRLGVLLAEARALGPAGAAALLGAHPREEFPHGLAEALEALAAGR
jgi:hypothetical protein